MEQICMHIDLEIRFRSGVHLSDYHVLVFWNFFNRGKHTI